MVGTYRPVEVHVGLTVKLVVHGEVQARDGRPRARRSALGRDAFGPNGSVWKKIFSKFHSIVKIKFLIKIY